MESCFTQCIRETNRNWRKLFLLRDWEKKIKNYFQQYKKHWQMPQKGRALKNRAHLRKTPRRNYGWTVGLIEVLLEADRERSCCPTDTVTGSLWDFLKISVMERSLTSSKQNAFTSTHYQIRPGICPIYKRSDSAPIKQSGTLGEYLITHLLQKLTIFYHRSIVP